MAAALLLQIWMPNGFPIADKGNAKQVQELSGSGAFSISEIMTANTATYVDEEGNKPDWIEIVNTSKSTQSLEGWSVARNQSGTAVYTFGNVALAPGERTVLFCDGKGTPGHAPFRLGSAGDTVMLFNTSGTAVESVNIPALSAGTSYARDAEGNWFVCYRPTPGEPNTQEGYEKLNTPQGGFAVRINEIVPSNKAAIKAGDGGTYDYVELYNSSSSAQDLTGCYLSDTPADRYSWRFPDGTKIPAGGYLVVFCSGLDRVDAAGYVHTGFRLSSGGETVLLTDASGVLRDSVKYGAMAANRAWSLGPNGWQVAVPSPGAQNP